MYCASLACIGCRNAPAAAAFPALAGSARCLGEPPCAPGGLHQPGYSSAAAQQQQRQQHATAAAVGEGVRRWA